MNQYDRLIREEGIDPREEQIRLTALFAQMKRVVQGLPGVTFTHLEPGEIGSYNRIEWNAWLYLASHDRVFPFRVAIEPGRHSQFRLRVHPDMEEPTDLTILTALRDVMREQMGHADAMHLRMRLWNEKREEPIGPRTRVA